jgi:hypothetical protein
VQNTFADGFMDRIREDRKLQEYCRIFMTGSFSCEHKQDNQCTYNAYAALSVQHAIRMGMRCINICDLPPLQYFSTLSHKWHAFRKKIIEQKMCFFYFLYNICLKCFSSLEEMIEM